MNQTSSLFGFARWEKDRFAGYDQQLSAIGGYGRQILESAARFKGAVSHQRHTLVGHAEYSFVESKNSSVPLDPRELGGFLNLSGIPRNSLIGQNLFFSSLVYRYKWFDNDFGLFEAPDRKSVVEGKMLIV